MAAMRSMIILVLSALVLLPSTSAFIPPHSRSPLDCRYLAKPAVRICSTQQRQQALPLEMSAEPIDEGSEMNALDKALVAWGVKSPPGEPEVDLKEKIKSAGVAGALAYGGTELAFWAISIPLAVFGYYRTTGEWLDLTTLEGKEKLFGLSAGFLTFARLVVPLRIALALALTPAMDKYVVKAFIKSAEAEEEEEARAVAAGAAAEVEPKANPEEDHEDETPILKVDGSIEGEELPMVVLNPGESQGLQERLRAAAVEERVRMLQERMDA